MSYDFLNERKVLNYEIENALEYVFNDNDILEKNNLAIILNKEIIIKGKKYLLIVALDIVSRKVVKLIDNYGKDQELFFYNKFMGTMDRGTVIKVPCKNYKSATSFNVLKIIGTPEILGKTNFSKLYNKFENMGLSVFNNIDIDTLENIVNSLPNLYIFLEVNMACRIRSYITPSGRKKFQLKIKDTFVDIIDDNKMWYTHDLWYYKGRVLLLAGKIRDKNIYKAYYGQHPGKFFKTKKAMLETYPQIQYDRLIAKQEELDELLYGDDYDRYIDYSAIDYADWNEEDDMNWAEENQ